MKKFFLIPVLALITGLAFGQSKNERELLEKTWLLSHTVFGSKDSMTLEHLFATEAIYGHSHGNLQTREQAITGISHNRSHYEDTAVSNVQILLRSKTAIVRHLFKAREIKPDGTVTPLNFSMLLVWIRERGDWKLMGRQAVSLDK